MQTKDNCTIESELHGFGLARGRLRTALSHSTGMAEADLDALEYLEAEGPLTQRGLGDRLLLTSGAITMLVDRLEQSGWVRRRPHPRDRRAVLIELTSRAEEEAPLGLREFHANLARLSESVDPGHREAIAEFLRQAAGVAASAAEDLCDHR